MSDFSTYKKLELPATPEKYNIQVFNKNNMIIDSELHKLDFKNQSQDELLAVTKELLNSEISRAAAKEDKISQDLDAETTRAVETENNLSDNIMTERDRAIESENSIRENLSEHNISDSSHNDIRDSISSLTARLNALADSDDTTLDQLSEIIAYIKNNKTLIDGITTSKVNVSDIIDNLNSIASDKPLSAKQGKMLKDLMSDFVDTIPAKVSQLENDSGYLNPGEKIAIWTDDEGGNLRIISPEGIIWEMDAHDGNFRIFTYENGIKLALEIDTAGKVTFPNTPIKTSTSLTATAPGIPLDQTAGKALKDQIDGMKTTFQAGVDALYDKCKSCGATPGAKTPAAISTAIQNIYTNRYNAGLSAGTSGKSNVWKSGEITAHKGGAGGKIYFSISSFTGYRNITKDNIFVEFTSIVSGSGGTTDTISYTYDKTTGEIIAQASAGGFYAAAQLVYQNFKAKITVIY